MSEEEIKKEIEKWPKELQGFYRDETAGWPCWIQLEFAEEFNKTMMNDHDFNSLLGSAVRNRSDYKVKDLSNATLEQKRIIIGHLARNYYQTFPRLLSQQNEVSKE